MTKLKEMINALRRGVISDADKETLIGVLDKIAKFVEENGEISIACGSEWLYQSDEAQVDGLELIAGILDSLSCYADSGEED